ncbi:putative phage repressor protein [Orrella dioscoreae]|uniref:Putative phage repressor protein n=2 Tax=Orrella dioscoreae TaxID=1851544 RepID=A0A1C3K7V4_9BURK|nr:putative phage repressor protein [Orrella dioscoreae]SOE48069.1 putative phage repressor protein [Orrella dioscoreae]
MDMAACLKVAPLLRVNPQWLYDGSGKMDAKVPAAPTSVTPAPWPLPAIPRERIESLAPAQLERLQGAIAFALAQVEQDVLVAPKPQGKRGSTVNLDDAPDDFPIGQREKMPWEGGWKPTPAGDLPLRLQDRGGVVANVSPGAPPAANDRFEKVPELGEVKLAAGEGIENDAEETTGHVQFRRSFLRSVGADGGRGRVVYAKGNSMEPHIKDGWAVLVVPGEFISVRELTPNSIYAINYDGKMIVKAVVKDPRTDRWVARSANPSHPDIVLEGDEAVVRVLGRVVWAGGLLREGESTQWVRR